MEYSAFVGARHTVDGATPFRNSTAFVWRTSIGATKEASGVVEAIRAKSNPLREALRQLHPELCQLIEDWRAHFRARRRTATALSHVLTRGERSMMVDSALSELHRQGIKAIIHHDVVVPESQADPLAHFLLRI